MRLVAITLVVFALLFGAGAYALANDTAKRSPSNSQRIQRLERQVLALRRLQCWAHHPSAVSSEDTAMRYEMDGAVIRRCLIRTK